MSEIAQLRQEQKKEQNKRKKADENKVDIAHSIQLASSTFFVKNSVFNDNARQRATFCNDFLI